MVPAAVGGVINVTTKKGRSNQAAKAEIGVVGFNTFKALAGFSGHQAEFDYSAAYSRTSFKDYDNGQGRCYANTGLDRRNTVNTCLGYFH
ncbi:MAG: hypothetical protein LBP22_14155 [Deltaproteobacteria bacterium]|jgi:outer membrane cobalamin receptor|nr:hypothetical protein [Deltaproteobacteria bacterium]